MLRNCGRAGTMVLLAVLILAGTALQAEARTPDQSFKGEVEHKATLICDNGSLAGDYAVMGSGFAAAPPQSPLPFATIGLMTMDGNGNLTHKVTRSNNGFISRGVDSGTYSVNTDCTGTITIATPNPPFQLTFDLVIAEFLGARSATEFYFIATTPGGAVVASAKRMR